MADRHHVVIVGSGFGGLWATRRLKDAPVDVTIVDRTTHHLFQPLLYQVATGILSEGEIAPPFRDIIRKQDNARVVLGEVTDIDIATRTVTARGLDRELELHYDSLVLAAGAKTSYFGNEEAFAPHAPGLKSIDDALDLRARIFGAFEVAELEEDPEVRAQWLTFVVVGAGPTGVEMAGQIAELSHRALKRNFRSIDPQDCRIVLVDADDKVLGQFGGKLPEKAARTLEKAGVELLLDTRVTGVDEHGIDLEGPGESHRIEARTKVWGAGVESSPLGRRVAEQAGVEVNRRGQVPVRGDCTLPGHPEVFVVGDLMDLHGLPGVAEVAMQTGRHAGGVIALRADGNQDFQSFHYYDLGTMASITRFSAVAEVGPIRISGFIGWLAWLVVHLTFLTGFKNRFSALVHWIVSFLGRSRAERAFTARQFSGGRKQTPVG
jgi:NADH:ubiquinone reductase (H+-translocating)